MKSQNGLIRPYHSKLTFVYRAVDLVLIVTTLFIAASFYGTPWSDRYGYVALVALIAFVFFAGKNDVYRSWRIAPLRDEIVKIWMAWLAAIFAVLFFVFAFKTAETFSRAVILMWVVSVPFILGLWRFMIRNFLWWARRNGHNMRTVAVIGANEYGSHLAKTLNNASWMGFKLLGFYDDRNNDRTNIGDSPHPIVGDIDRLVQFAKLGEVDAVYIALPLRAENRIAELIDRFADTTVSVYYTPDFFALDLLHARWFSLGDIPVVSVYETPFFGVDGWLKRLQDIVLGSCILTIAAIPMLLIAMGVKLTSPGPVLFKQRRYGINGQTIDVWKFRSMTVCEDDDNVIQASRCDSRVTPFGSFLRRSSLDELPQLFNILRGTMSLVGPRPHAVKHNEEYRQLIRRYMLRHKVKPGMTGWAQVNGWRGETDTLDKMEKRVQFDLEYIQNWSLALDIRIIISTMVKVFNHKNAY